MDVVCKGKLAVRKLTVNPNRTGSRIDIETECHLHNAFACTHSVNLQSPRPGLKTMQGRQVVSTRPIAAKAHSLTLASKVTRLRLAPRQIRAPDVDYRHVIQGECGKSFMFLPESFWTLK